MSVLLEADAVADIVARRGSLEGSPEREAPVFGWRQAAGRAEYRGEGTGTFERGALRDFGKRQSGLRQQPPDLDPALFRDPALDADALVVFRHARQIQIVDRRAAVR